MKTNELPVIVEADLNAPIERVWLAITDPAEMTLWFFKEITDFHPKVSFETQFTIELENRSFVHLWKIVAVEPGRSITYNWKYAGYPGDSLLTMQLTSAGAGTRFRLEHRTTEDFPADIPEFTYESCLAGWRYLIQGSLKDYLEK